MLFKSLKLAIMALLGIFFLLVYLHIGGMWIIDGAEGWVVIHKHPTINKEWVYRDIDDGPEAAQARNDFADKHFLKVCATRELDGFFDIKLTAYASLILSIVIFIKLINLAVKRKDGRPFIRAGHIKLFALGLVGIFLLYLFLYIGGVQFTNSGEGYLMLAKHPAVDKHWHYTSTGAGHSASKAFYSFLDENVFKICYAQQINNINHIRIIAYTSLGLSVGIFIRLFFFSKKRKK